MTAPITHTVTFERNIRTGQWRGLCATCMWCRVGERDVVQAQAATHDLDWQPVEPEKVPA